MSHALSKVILLFKLAVFYPLKSLLEHFPSFFPQSFYRWVHIKSPQNSFEYLHIASKRAEHAANARRGEQDHKNFDDTQSIFIHIPKTAGMAVAEGLYGGWETSVYPSSKMGHASLRKYQWVFSPSEFHDYFKFAFVRNPWDRVFSAYSYLVRGGFNDEDMHWSETHIGNASFEEFVLKKIACEPVIFDKVHFIPQYSFLISYTMRNYPLDFIGFFENLEQDFETLKARINPAAKLGWANRSTAPQSYRLHYNDEMRAVVGERYQKDIDLFGYNFDNSSLPEQLSKRSKNELLIQRLR